MPETYWTDAGDNIVVDGSDQPIDCGVCCPIDCDSNDRGSGMTPVPRSLAATVTYFDTGNIPFTMEWNDLSEQWENVSGDVLICGNFYLRDVVLQCTDTPGSFYLELTVVVGSSQYLFINDVIIFRTHGNTNPFSFGFSKAVGVLLISGCPDDQIVTVNIHGVEI